MLRVLLDAKRHFDGTAARSCPAAALAVVPARPAGCRRFAGKD
jgi:hypothetical protein